MGPAAERILEEFTLRLRRTDFRDLHQSPPAVASGSIPRSGCPCVDERGQQEQSQLDSDRGRHRIPQTQSNDSAAARREREVADSVHRLPSFAANPTAWWPTIMGTRGELSDPE